jgi:hypothetical protein
MKIVVFQSRIENKLDKLIDSIQLSFKNATKAPATNSTLDSDFVLPLLPVKTVQDLNEFEAKLLDDFIINRKNGMEYVCFIINQWFFLYNL